VIRVIYASYCEFTAFQLINNELALMAVAAHAVRFEQVTMPTRSPFVELQGVIGTAKVDLEPLGIKVVPVTSYVGFHASNFSGYPPRYLDKRLTRSCTA
jgi:hypothetical protein